MKMRSLLLLAVAAGCGLVAMFGMMQVLNNRPQGEPKVRVLVATQDIPQGLPLDKTNVTFVEYPQSVVPEGAVITAEQVAGKAVTSRVLAGEMILEGKLGGSESIVASHTIPKGMRVATVSVDATSSHSGLIRPSDRVDVLCTYLANEIDNRQSTRVKTVLEYIEVFAVDSMRAGREGDVEASVKNVSWS